MMVRVARIDKPNLYLADVVDLCIAEPRPGFHQDAKCVFWLHEGCWHITWKHLFAKFDGLESAPGLTATDQAGDHQPEPGARLSFTPVGLSSRVD